MKYLTSPRFWTLSAITFAAGASVASPVLAALPNSINGLIGKFCTLVSYAQFFFWALAVAMIIFSAYMYLTSAGSPEQFKKATTSLLYTVIAIVVAVLASSFPVIINAFLGGGDSVDTCSTY